MKCRRSQAAVRKLALIRDPPAESVNELRFQQHQNITSIQKKKKSEFVINSRLKKKKKNAK